MVGARMFHPIHSTPLMAGGLAELARDVCVVRREGHGGAGGLLIEDPSLDSGENRFFEAELSNGHSACLHHFPYRLVA